MHLLITGMHRSGTSLTAQLLRELGVYFGDPEELLPPAEDNPEGFCERYDVMDVNEYLLINAGASWHSPPSGGLNFWRRGFSDSQLTLIEQARQAIRKLNARPSWAIKDPRFCLTLGVWSRLIPDARYLVCFRNPYEVARSLNKRQGFDEDYCLDLWLRHYQLLMQATRQDQRLVIPYRRLLDQGERELRRIAGWLALQPPESAVRAALSRIRTDLHHHRVERPDQLPRGVPPPVRAMYGRLLAEAETSGGTGVPSAPLPGGRVAAERKVIVYHRFLMDSAVPMGRLLQANFRDGCVDWEDGGRAMTPESLAEFIMAHPEAEAVLTRSAPVRMPGMPRVRLFPVVCLYHPMNWVEAIYRADRARLRDAPGPNQARRSDLKGYVEWRLGFDRRFRNFQTGRLATWADGSLSELARASRAIAELPFVGLAERFGESAERLEAWLKPEFPGFSRAALEESAVPAPEERLEALRSEIGNDLYRRLVRENRDDLALYEAAEAVWDDGIRGGGRE
jgi:hypothetical protein